MSDLQWPGTPVAVDSGAAAEPVWPGTPIVPEAGPNRAATFDERFGDGPMSGVPAKPGVAEDVAKTVPSALARGTAGVIGIPGLVSGGADWLFSKITGASPEELAAARATAAGPPSRYGFGLPSPGDVLTPEKVTGAIESVTGPLYKSQTPQGRYVGAVAEMAPGALLGGGTAWERALSTIGAGIGSEGGGDLFAGTWFEPYAKFVGGILGGIGGGVAPKAAERSFAGVKEAGKTATAPFTEAGQQRLAARQLEQRAENPTALRAALEEPASMYPGAQVGELVPGAKPTTFQRTGDMGIGALEREVATANPVDFQMRRGEQSAARVAAMREIQPNGSAADIPNILRAQLKEIDDATQSIVDRVAGQARKAADDIGGSARPDEIGEGMRAAAAAARKEAKAAEKALWRAVDPDNSLTLDVSPLRAAASTVEDRIGASAKPIIGEERAILDVVNGYQPVIPFNELTDLRSRVSAAMREERRASGETPALARLTQLRGAIENTIDTAVERRVAQESHAVASGAMRAEDTIEAKLLDQFQRWKVDRDAGLGAVARDGTSGAPRTSTIPAAPGAGSEGFGGSGGSARNQSLPGQPLVPNLDEAAAERLKAASTATRERAQTYDRGPVGDVLRTSGMADEFRILDGAVPSRFFRPGPEGLERVTAFRDAVKDPAKATAGLVEAAAASLRKAAERPDGLIDPAKFAAWQKAHAPALAAIPEVGQRFATAARATEAVSAATTARKQALDAAQIGTAGKLLGMSDPQDVVRTVRAIFGQKDAVKEMRELASRVKGHPEGTAGLRRAVVDHIEQKFLSNTEAAASGADLIRADQFQNFVRQNRGTLAQVFEPKDIQILDAIAADLKRANRSITAIKLPGGSNTPQDMLAAARGSESVLARLVKLGQSSGPGSGAVAGFFAMGPKGVPLGAAAGWLNSARNAGMQKVQDLVKEALLDPDLARTLLKKAPPQMDRGPWLELGRQLNRLAVFGVEGAASDRQDRQARKAGGRVEPSEAQKEAGNYAKEHVTFQGMPLAIETRRGHVRTGRGADGKEWSVKMPADYGYVKRTEGADGDHVDAYVGPDKEAKLVWIVDQVDPKTREFDEHKLMLGFKNRGHAEQTYRAGFSDGKGGKRIGAITAMDMPSLKNWLASSKTKKPVGIGR